MIEINVEYYNVAYGKPASQSSDFNGNNIASRAVDGNSNNGITHTKSSTDPWWSVDLQTIYIINEIKVYNRIDSNEKRLNGFILHIVKNNVEVCELKYKMYEASCLD